MKAKMEMEMEMEVEMQRNTSKQASGEQFGETRRRAALWLDPVAEKIMAALKGMCGLVVRAVNMMMMTMVMVLCPDEVFGGLYACC